MFISTDIQLFSRNRAYNVVALLEFTVETLTIYYQRKLAKYAGGDSTTAAKKLRVLNKKAEYLSEDSIMHK